jgi:pyruvate dehydrogenase E1 component
VASFDETGPLINGLLSQVPDIDPAETSEWLESLDGLIDDKGGPRARYLLLSLLKRARERNIAVPGSLNTPYVNTIGVDEEP